MRTIDIHAHLLPQCAWRAFDAGQDWYGFRYEADQGLGTTVSSVRRDGIPTPKLRFTPEERIKDMDEQGVDVHVVSMATAWFGYHLDPAQGLQQAREVLMATPKLFPKLPLVFSLQMQHTVYALSMIMTG